MTDSERVDRIHEYLSRWDWVLMPLMPISEDDGLALLKILESREKGRRKRHEWYMENQERVIEKSKRNYQKRLEEQGREMVYKRNKT